MDYLTTIELPAPAGLATHLGLTELRLRAGQGADLRGVYLTEEDGELHPTPLARPHREHLSQEALAPLLTALEAALEAPATRDLLRDHAGEVVDRETRARRDEDEGEDEGEGEGEGGER